MKAKSDTYPSRLAFYTFVNMLRMYRHSCSVHSDSIKFSLLHAAFAFPLRTSDASALMQCSRYNRIKTIFIRGRISPFLTQEATYSAQFGAHEIYCGIKYRRNLTQYSGHMYLPPCVKSTSFMEPLIHLWRPFFMLASHPVIHLFPIPTGVYSSHACSNFVAIRYFHARPTHF